MDPALTREQLDAIVRFDTCSIANAIETFQIRLRNEGYSRPGLHSLTNPQARVIGYAAPCKVRSSDPPLDGISYFDRTDWWKRIEQIPLPRFAVIEDADLDPGVGASIGEVHSAILKALGCAGAVTNGSVRDIPAVTALHFPLFACSVSVSHAYIHMLDFGQEAEICGLRIRAGDLLYADQHGLLNIPKQLAAELPAVAARLRTREQRILEACDAETFSLEKVRTAIGLAEQ